MSAVEPPERASEQLAQAVPSADAPLSDLQAWMARLIVHERALSKSPALSDAAALHFAGNDRLSPAEQIDVYRQQFWLRHTGILIDHFPGLSRFLGQDAWEPIAESYLQRPESSVVSLTQLGHRMAEHLEELPPFEHQALCVDMARLEWAYQEAFGAPDDPVLTAERLLGLSPADWETARFVLGSSLRLLRLRHPVHDLRRRLRQGSGADELADQAGARPTNLVVYRRNRELWDKCLSESAYSLLCEFERGRPLVEACEAVMKRHPPAERVFDEELTEWFSLWGRLGWIVDVRVETPPA